MNKTDFVLTMFYDLRLALGLLTRLPIRVDMDRATDRGAKAAWAYPLVGCILGALCAMLASALIALGVPLPLTAGLVLALSVILTGAMHEDGLADSADGLWGGWDRTKRLDIMKDSRVGVYGVCALILAFLLRWGALTEVFQTAALWPALIAAAALSRGAMLGVMAALPHARADGLSSSVGRPSRDTAALGGAVAVLISCLCGYWWLPLVAIAAAVACGAIAKAKIGGQTGDTLGATQQVTEIALLATLAAALA